MDGFVRRRLRSILRKYQKKGRGTGRNIHDHQQWTNAYFASLGLFTMYEAHAEASRSRWGNYRLESRVREKRLHGSEGRESLEGLFSTPIDYKELLSLLSMALDTRIPVCKCRFFKLKIWLPRACVGAEHRRASASWRQRVTNWIPTLACGNQKT